MVVVVVVAKRIVRERDILIVVAAPSHPLPHLLLTCGELGGGGFPS